MTVANLLFGLIVVQAPNSSQQQSWTERAYETAITGARRVYERVIKEGKPLAEAMMKNSPRYYQSLESSILAFAKKVERGVANLDIADKQRLVLELWRLRTAINVMALADPEVLRSVTGIDLQKFQIIKRDFGKTEAKVKKLGLPGV